jgi:hypothetical protein
MFSQLSNNQKIALQLAFVLVLSGLAVAIIIALGATHPIPGSHQVHFQVEASGGYAIITFQAGDVAISKPETVTVPWTRTLQVPKGTQVYLTASNPTQTGNLSCAITLDNAPWKLETTTAPKDGVACAGIVP